MIIRWMIAVCLVLVMAAPVSAQSMYHEITVHVEGDYIVTMSSHGNLVHAKGRGVFRMARKSVSIPETVSLPLVWWDLF